MPDSFQLSDEWWPLQSAVRAVLDFDAKMQALTRNDRVAIDELRDKRDRTVANARNAIIAGEIKSRPEANRRISVERESFLEWAAGKQRIELPQRLAEFRRVVMTISGDLGDIGVSMVGISGDMNETAALLAKHMWAEKQRLDKVKRDTRAGGLASARERWAQTEAKIQRVLNYPEASKVEPRNLTTWVCDLLAGECKQPGDEAPSSVTVRAHLQARGRVKTNTKKKS
jgi:hypothetical protein